MLTRLSQLDKLIRSLKRGRPVEEWEGLLFNRLESAECPFWRRSSCPEGTRAVGLERGAHVGVGIIGFRLRRLYAEAEALSSA